MRILPKEAWRYAALLIILFCIAGLAVWQVLQFLSDKMEPAQFRIAALLVWSLTMGFLLIAGAFGLWAIQFSAEGEGRRRVARLVDAMYYISDAVLAIDQRARVRGSNPAVGRLTGQERADDSTLQTLFPCLSPKDLDRFTSGDPEELERHMVTPDGVRILRFRSQPSEGLTLVLVSDVTTMNEKLSKRRQSAQLQLIGELARAVAYDFDSILCAIAGHAALLNRLPEGSPDAVRSRDAIAGEAEKGVVLAGHLRQLASAPIGSETTTDIGPHVQAAATSLRDMLPQGWDVSCEGKAAPGSVALTGLQIEQTVLQLGLAIAESVPGMATIAIRVTRAQPPTHPDRPPCAASVLLRCSRPGETEGAGPHMELKPDTREGGLIVSVIRTLLEEAGGSLDILVADDGMPVFRANLPRGSERKGARADVPDELRSYISNWSILCAGTKGWRPDLPQAFRSMGLRASHSDDVATALSAIEQDTGIDVAVFHERILGHEPQGLLKAILKIRRGIGIVVVAEATQPIRDALGHELTCVPPQCSDGELVTALVEAKGLSARRK